MKDGAASAHLSPDQFVDVLEASPVEAEIRQHLAGCIECRRELRDLEETLGVVRAEARGAPGFRRYASWAGAAAAIVAAVVFLYRGAPGNEPHPAAEIQLLAPIGEDSGYRILEAFSRQLQDDDDALSFPLMDFHDASELSPGELRDLADRLAREMSSIS